MKNPTRTILILTLALLVATSARAIPVNFSFSGTVSSVTDPGFATLLTAGDVASGLFSFDLEAPIFSTPWQTPSGGYSVSAGFVSGFSLLVIGAGASPPYASLDFRGGTGPTAMGGGYQRMLQGIWIGMDVDGSTATLDDYLALTATDFRISLIGGTDYGFGWGSGGVADLNVTSASFTTASPSVPDAGNTSLLLLASLGALPLARLKLGSFLRARQH